MNKRINFFKAIGARLLQTVIVLFCVSFVTFSLMYIAPGDAATALYESNGIIASEEMLEAAREQLGLNEPFLVQYLDWLNDCLHGDFGTSTSKKVPVMDLLQSRLMPTVNLALLSLGIMLVVSIPLGILAAVYQNRLPDMLIRLVTFAGISVPGFLVALILLYFVALKWNWVSVVGIGTGLERMILPATTLAIAMSAKYTRQIRAALLEEFSQEYITGAKARGMSKSYILWHEALPNAMLPIITLLGLSIGSLLGGTAVVEIVFAYPGLGELAISAVLASDYPLIQGVILWIALAYMIVNLIVDISYQFIDPRIREGGGL